jgi:hypothetical protein
VVFSDNANPDAAKLKGGADRTVYYQAAKMDENGQIDTHDIDNNATLALHEKMDPKSKNPDQLIAKTPHPEEGGTYEDYQYVKPNEQYRVLRDWKVNGESARVYDKQSGKAYRYEVTTLDANAKVAIKTEYMNTAPF